MDRYTTNIAGCSIGFMNVLVAPAYDALIQVLPNASVCMDNLNSNKERWEELKDEFKARMDEKKNFIPESRGVIKDENEKLPSIVPNNMLSNFNALEGTGVNLLNQVNGQNSNEDKT